MHQQLVTCALQAATAAYAPYSQFSVGAALRGVSGKLYTGSNVENASFGASNCAERTAFFTAVHQGERAFSAIAIAALRVDGTCTPAYPCGICRQVMREFCDDSFVVLVATPQGYSTHTLGELLPFGFSRKDL